MAFSKQRGLLFPAASQSKISHSSSHISQMTHFREANAQQKKDYKTHPKPPALPAQQTASHVGVARRLSLTSSPESQKKGNSKQVQKKEAKLTDFLTENEAKIIFEDYCLSRPAYVQELVIGYQALKDKRKIKCVNKVFSWLKEKNIQAPFVIRSGFTISLTTPINITRVLAPHAGLEMNNPVTISQVFCIATELSEDMLEEFVNDLYKTDPEYYIDMCKQIFEEYNLADFVDHPRRVDLDHPTKLNKYFFEIMCKKAWKRNQEDRAFDTDFYSRPEVIEKIRRASNSTITSYNTEADVESVNSGDKIIPLHTAHVSPTQTAATVVSVSPKEVGKSGGYGQFFTYSTSDSPKITAATSPVLIPRPFQ